MSNEKQATITVRLSNGTLVTIPFKDCKNTLEKMEKELQQANTKKEK